MDPRMESSSIEKNLKYLEDFLSRSASPEKLKEWLKNFNHLRNSDFAIYYFEQVNEALEVFHEPEVKEPTRIQLQSFPIQNAAPSSSATSVKVSPKSWVKSSQKLREISSSETLSEVSIDVNDSQAFPSLGASLSVNTSSAKKRITPRRVSAKAVHGNAKFIKSNYSITENREEGFNDVRNELKIKRKQQSSHSENSSEFQSTKHEFIESSKFEEYKNKDKDQKEENGLVKAIHSSGEIQDPKILALSMMFIDFLQKSLFFRPTTFNDLLLFIIQILNRELRLPSPVLEPEIEPKDLNLIKHILNSPAKCFHFAYLIFEEIFIVNGLLYQLSKPALLSILLNHELLSYKDSMNLSQKVETILDVRYNEYKRIYSRNFGIQQFVPYDVDLDSIDNFPNAHGFHQFRKQRDCFNSLLQAYYNNTWRLDLTSDDKAMFTFINKIHATMASKSYFRFNNFSMLAKLFVDQMLRTRNIEQSAAGTSHCLKFELLENRITKSSSSSMIDSFNTHFVPEELFFKDFIFYGDSHIFNQHLLLAMKNKLKEFQYQLICLLCSAENIDDYEENFIYSIENILLLSKFIGFIDFYPFHVSKETSGKNVYIDNQSILRLEWNRNMDVLNVLIEHFNSCQHLFIFIPSIVQYLLFADVVTFNHEVIQHCVFLLSAIYKFCLPKIICENHQFPLGRQFIQCFLEKFFTSKNINPDKAIENPALLSIYYNLLLASNGFENTSIVLNRGSHPFLLAKHNEAFSKSFQEIFERKNKQSKHITMLSFPFSGSQPREKKNDDQYTKANFQEALIGRFFQHSKYLRTSFEFFHDSTYKSCINALNKQLQNATKGSSKNTKEYPFLRSEFQKEFPKFIANEYDKIFEGKSMTFHRIMLDSGYSEDSSRSVIEISKQLIKSQCESWFFKQILSENLAANRTTTEDRQLKPASEGRKDTLENITRQQSEEIAKFFEIVRYKLPKLRHREPVEISVEAVFEDYIKIRQLPDSSLIDKVFIDFFFTVLAMKPETMSEKFRLEAIKTLSDHGIRLPKVISQNVLTMLEQSPKPMEAWSSYEHFLLEALRYRIIDFEHFQNVQVMPLLKVDWQVSTLGHLSAILDRFVKTAQELKIIGENDNFILDWMSWSLKDDQPSEL